MSVLDQFPFSDYNDGRMPITGSRSTSPECCDDRRRILAGFVAIAAFAAPLDAQETRVFDGAPPASWIAPPGVPGDSFTVFHARRTFDLTAVPARFVVHVSADNRYRLYVNGVQVSSGPQRSDVTHWRYETLDLAPHLRAGRNVIAALVWNWGAARPVAQHSHRTGFLLQGNGPVEAALVNTGTQWKLLRDPAYAPIVITTATLGDYYAAAPGDSIDGSRYPWGWERADYVDDAWSAGAIVGRVKRRAMAPGDYGEVSGWQLEARSIPPMEEKEQRLARVRRATGVETDGAFLRGSGDLVIPARTTAVLLLDQSHTTNAYPVLETSGGAGSMVRLTYAEALIDAAGQKGNRNEIEGRTVRGVRDVFLPDGGARRRFTTLYWRSFRYIQMDVTTADEPLRVHDLHGIFTAYPFAERARFASDLPWLADMWRMNWNGARIGAFETYMDTPYWEQLQYIGDTRVQGLISLYVAGDDRLLRQAIEHFDLSRIPEGITASRYPSALTQIIPPFSLIYVAMVHDFSCTGMTPRSCGSASPACAGSSTGSAATWMPPACWARCHTGTTSIGRHRGIGAFRPAPTMGTRPRSACCTCTRCSARRSSRRESGRAVRRPTIVRALKRCVRRYARAPGTRRGDCFATRRTPVRTASRPTCSPSSSMRCPSRRSEG